MKIKLDENLPVGLASMLNSLSHDVQTVREEGLMGRADLEIWEAAQKEGVAEWAGCFVVATERKVRVLRP